MKDKYKAEIPTNKIGLIKNAKNVTIAVIKGRGVFINHIEIIEKILTDKYKATTRFNGYVFDYDTGVTSITVTFKHKEHSKIRKFKIHPEVIY